MPSALFLVVVLARSKPGFGLAWRTGCDVFRALAGPLRIFP